ncbi:MAG: methylated-DNA--[protein]-cysteine S-methyltransferase [Desulfosoma sp.]
MSSFWVDLFFLSSWGWILTAATDKGVCACHILSLSSQKDTASSQPFHVRQAAEAFLLRLFPHWKPIWKPNEVSMAAREALMAYFSGSREHPRVPVHWISGTPFQHKVWQELCRIPYGATLCYGDVANRLGLSQGARAVGQACGKNPTAIFVPCHRVVGRHGSLGGYSGGVHIKKALLALEEAWPEIRRLP